MAVPAIIHFGTYHVSHDFVFRDVSAFFPSHKIVKNMSDTSFSDDVMLKMILDATNHRLDIHQLIHKHITTLDADNPLNMRGKSK